MPKYPIDMPDLPIRSIEVRKDHSSVVNSSGYTKDQNVYNWSGEVWKIRMKPSLLNKTNASEWRSFIIKLRGQHGTFNMRSDIKNNYFANENPSVFRLERNNTGWSEKNIQVDINQIEAREVL